MSENMSKRSEYKKMMLRLARFYINKGEFYWAKNYIKPYWAAERAVYGFFPDEKYEGDFSFVRKVSLEDVRIILSTLAGKTVTKIDYYEPYFTRKLSLNKKTSYTGSIEKEDDRTFSLKTPYGKFRNIDYEIADLRGRDINGRPVGGKIHHVEIRP